MSADQIQTDAPTVATPTVLRSEIDTNCYRPFIAGATNSTKGTTVYEHMGAGRLVIERRGDDLLVGGKRVVLHYSNRQQNGRSILGLELRKELRDKPVLNARILDFLLENTAFIPDSWKGEEAGKVVVISFWGSIYRDSDDYYCVRSLWWRDNTWCHSVHWIVHLWGDSEPAAVLEEPVS